MSAPRRHARNISHPMPRRNTMGPLGNDDDPLAAPSTTSITTAADDNDDVGPGDNATEQPLAATNVPRPLPASRTPDPTQSPVASSPHRQQSSLPARPPVDLTFLLDRNAYHLLPTAGIVPEFLSASFRPPLEATLPALLQGGHFRRAAEVAVRLLAQSSPDATARILQLFYTRLACLILIARPDLALQESLSLLDVVTRSAPDVAEALLPIVPWDLRLLLVRLQSIGAPEDEGRRGVMALYALTAEVRAHLRVLQQQQQQQREEEDNSSSLKELTSTVALWTARLRDLGLRVCDALVEMGELETALRHLATLASSNSLPATHAQEIFYRQTLLHLRLGDIPAAAHYSSRLTADAHRLSFATLIDIASTSVPSPSASETLATYQTHLLPISPSHELAALNAATALLYAGHVGASRRALESLLHGSAQSNAPAEAEDTSRPPPPFPALLFNLATVYELCGSEASARENKLQLVRDLAARTPRPEYGGWERPAAEVKL